MTVKLHPDMNTSTHPQNALPTKPATKFSWYRFWVRTLIAVVIFNIIAGFVTWYWLFPHLHPAH